MRKTTKFLTLVLAVIMTVSMFVTGASAAFEDVDYSTAEGDAVNLLVSLGVTKGTTETKFGTDELVTRQQMAAFIYRLMKAGKSVEGGVNTSTFTDLEDATFFYMVSWANQTGVIKGVSETKFNPKGNITLQDAYTMVVRALGYEADGALSYPFGYIEKAEEIGLDEDLPATLGYADNLTRGNVAVILANAFYADMATYEVAYKPLGYTIVGNDGASYDAGEALPEYTNKIIGYEQVKVGEDANGDDIFADDPDAPIYEEFEIKAAFSKGQTPYNKYDTVASKIFGVEKIVQYVVATPTFTFDVDNDDDYDDDRLDEADVEMIKFNKSTAGILGADPDDDDIDVSKYAVETIEFAELGLEGKADDYFLAGIELYIRKNDNDEREILGATSLMTKKTVKGEDIVFGTLSGSSDTKFYTFGEVDPGNDYALFDENDYVDDDGNLTTDWKKDASDYRRMNGLLTIDGVKTYIFDAPYSYAKPDDIADINADNAKFITLGAYEGEWEDEDEPVEVQFNYGYGPFNFGLNYEETLKKDKYGDITEKNAAALACLENAYFGGFYEMDVYDIDNDGRYEFISYKPYVVGEIDTDEDNSLVDNGFTADSIIMTDRSIVIGEEVEDKDIVLAVVNAEANFVDIKAVLEPTETHVTTKATTYAKFASGEKHTFKFADKVLFNAAADLANENVFGVDNTDQEYYFYEGKLVKSDAIASKLNFNEDWVIVLAAGTEKTAVMNGNKLETDAYVRIYHDGEIKDVKAKKITDAMMKKDRWNEEYFQTYFVDDEGKGYFDYADYVGKLATAKVDADGAYYFDILDIYDDDTNGFYVDGELSDVGNLEYNENDDTSDLIYAYQAKNVTFTKKSGYNYEISDTGAAKFDYVTVKDYTQIIIEAIDEDGEQVFEVYGYDNLPDFDDGFEFDEVTVIVANNNVKTPTRENLVLFYGKVDAEVEVSDGKAMDYRVVLSWYSEQNEDEEEIFTVTAFNPATGEKEDLVATDVDITNIYKNAILVKTTAGKLSTEYLYGEIYSAAGAPDLDVDPAGNKLKASDKVGKLGYVKVVEYDEESNLLEIDGDYDAGVYTVTKETKFFEYDHSDASVKEVTVDVLTSTSKKLNIDGKDEDENPNTFKAIFMSASEDDTADEDGTYNVNYIVIVHK